MSTHPSQSRGSFTSGPEDSTEQAKKSENETGSPRQEHPVSNEDVRNATYSTKSQNFTEQKTRTDLRTVEEHCSWREVARACHCEPGR